MQLRQATLQDVAAAGVGVPKYDRAALRRSIVHIGVGGFHRAHLATFIDELCRAGVTDWSIVGAGVLPDDERMARVLEDQDNLYTLIVRASDATEIRVIGSIVDYVHAHPDPESLVARIADPDVAIVSMTVTEKGYPVDGAGAFDGSSRNAAEGSAFDLLTRGLERRRASGAPPVTVLSCDNVTGNGTMARRSVLGVADARDAALAAWIEATVAFPNSMVDRITPTTTETDRERLAAEHGVEDGWPVVTEPFRQWVVEDRFAGERLPLEDLDVIVTDDVEPYESFKLRLLNAGHSVLAYAARLAGHSRVDEVMAEPRFEGLLTRFLETEAGPVVPSAPGIDLDEYVTSLVTRFSNPAIGDQVDRLCVDGTSKIPTFVLPTVRDQLAASGPIEVAALAIAAWCRYLQGEDDEGASIDLAADPQLDEAAQAAHAAADDRAAFLEFDEVFGNLGDDQRLREAFTAALTSIEADGIRSAIDRMLAR